MDHLGDGGKPCARGATATATRNSSHLVIPGIVDVQRGNHVRLAGHNHGRVDVNNNVLRLLRDDECVDNIEAGRGIGASEVIDCLTPVAARLLFCQLRDQKISTWQGAIRNRALKCSGFRQGSFKSFAHRDFVHRRVAMLAALFAVTLGME